MSVTDSAIDGFLCRALVGSPAPWKSLGSISTRGFVDRCQHHGISGLLFHGLRATSEWSGWPVDVRDFLEQAAMAGVAQDLLRGEHLARLMRTFDDRGIGALLIKGEALARTCYPVPGTRSRSDMDVFIGIEHVPAVRSAVQALGYRVLPPFYKSHQFTALRPGDASLGVRFDIHWRILNHPRYARCLSFEDAFERSVEVPGLDRARTLCKPDALLLACMHRHASTRHDPDRLIWILDVHHLASSMPVEEQHSFVTRALERGAHAACCDGILQAQKRFGTTFPAELLERLQPKSATAAARRDPVGQSQLGLLWDDFRRLPGISARAELLGELLVPSAAELLDRYNKKSRLWIPLLYARRAIDGVAGGKESERG